MPDASCALAADAITAAAVAVACAAVAVSAAAIAFVAKLLHEWRTWHR